MNNTEETNAVIAAAEAQAACYTGDPRLDECFKADIMNAFFAGSTFQKEWTAKQIAAIGTAKQRYNELRVEDEVSDPIERLRAFCSLAMNGQDWVDVEPFFDAVLAKLASKPNSEYMTAYEQECQDIAADSKSFYEVPESTSNIKSNRVELTQEVLDHCWTMYQQGQISVDHPAKQVFEEVLRSFHTWVLDYDQ